MVFRNEKIGSWGREEEIITIRDVKLPKSKGEIYILKNIEIGEGHTKSPDIIKAFIKNKGNSQEIFVGFGNQRAKGGGWYGKEVGLLKLGGRIKSD